MTYTCTTCPADYTYKTRNYSEVEAPIQGSVDNCSFMASLIAVAWVTGFQSAAFLPATSWPKKIDLNSSPKRYQIPFWNAPGTAGLNSAEFWVSEKFWMDENKNFKYGHSSELKELWPAVMEKAFANFIQADKTKDMDDMSQIGWSSFDSPPLMTLSGWTPNTPKTTAGKTGDTLYSEIGGKTSGKKTTRPMIGWTKAACPTDAQMKPNHTYAILGIWLSGNIKYIVLRNPLGKMAGGNTIGALVAGSWTAVNDTWYNEKKEAVGGPGLVDKSFDATIGLFALPADKFQAYFTAYSWVGLP